MSTIHLTLLQTKPSSSHKSNRMAKDKNTSPPTQNHSNVHEFLQSSDNLTKQRRLQSSGLTGGTRVLLDWFILNQGRVQSISSGTENVYNSASSSTNSCPRCSMVKPLCRLITTVWTKKQSPMRFQSDIWTTSLIACARRRYAGLLMQTWAIGSSPLLKRIVTNSRLCRIAAIFNAGGLHSDLEMLQLVFIVHMT